MVNIGHKGSTNGKDKPESKTPLPERNSPNKLLNDPHSPPPPLYH